MTLPSNWAAPENYDAWGLAGTKMKMTKGRAEEFRITSGKTPTTITEAAGGSF